MRGPRPWRNSKGWPAAPCAAEMRRETGAAAPAAAQGPAALWNARVAAITANLKEALGRGGDAAQELKLRFSEAQVFARKADYPKALEILGRVESLLKVKPPAGAPASPVASAAKPAAVAGKVPPATKVVLQQSRLAWDASRKKIHGDLGKLEQSILELFADDPRLAEVRQKVRKLDQVLLGFGTELEDTLDEALNASEAEKPKLQAKAAAVLKRYRAYLANDPLVKAVAQNPTAPIDLTATLGGTLALLEKKLVG